MLALATGDRVPPGRFGEDGVVTTTAYTDGACQGNPGPGGWAWAVKDGPFRSGAEARTTNQRMEIHAALSAVTTLDGPLVVVTDSTYVCNCFRDRWWESWVANGWRNKAKKPVANQDLWKPLIDAVQADRGRVTFQWVKGHSGDVMNDLVDRLAVDAAREQVGRSGTGHPEVLGPADIVGGRGRAGLQLRGQGSEAAGVGQGTPDPGVPAGHRVVIAGLRPPGLGGYGDTLASEGVRTRLAEILAAKRQLHPDLVVLTGLGLGAEQLGAEAAVREGVPYVAVLPYPEQESVWPPSSRDHYEKLLTGATGEVTLQGKRPDSRPAAGGALARRNAWLARHGHEAIVVWDGRDELVGKLVRSLQDHLGEEDVWLVEPEL